MKKLGIVILVSAIVAAAAPAPAAPQPAATIATHKSVAEFGGCFVDAQDRLALAWSYVPKADGGTFSNLGANGVTSAYFLAVLDRGTVRELRLEPVKAALPVDARVTRAVDQCA